MSKWKCEICSLEFENFHAQGFNNKIYCPLCYYKKLYKDTELEREKLQNIIDKNKYTADELKQEIERLNDKCKQLQTTVKEVREYIENNDLYEQDVDYDCEENMVLGPPSDEIARKILLQILDKEK